jgi:hypothetical protein
MDHVKGIWQPLMGDPRRWRLDTDDIEGVAFVRRADDGSWYWFLTGPTIWSGVEPSADLAMVAAQDAYKRFRQS